MAAGDILLDGSGNRMLDASGNLMLDDGSGNACCCAPSCDTPSYRCAPCGGYTPDSMLITVSGVSVCGLGCHASKWNIGSDTTTREYSKITYDFSNYVNGTFCVPKSAVDNDCFWSTNHGYAGEIVRTYSGYPFHTVTDCDEAYYNRSNTGPGLISLYVGTDGTYFLEIGIGGGGGNLFEGSGSATDLSEPRPCYRTVTIANTLTMNCGATSSTNHTWGPFGSGGSATITPCC